jgi:hypothetical protein
VSRTTHRLQNVTSSEPDDASDDGDGDTTGDLGMWSPGTPQTAFTLRAERSGNGPGRVYQMHYEATDASGNSTPAVAIVTVPHDQGAGPEPLLMQLRTNGAPDLAEIFWPAPPNVIGYDVIGLERTQIVLEVDQTILDGARVLARGIGTTHLYEDSAAGAPGAFIYFIQSRTVQGGSGYGTASAPGPRIPESCDGGCP